MFSAIKIFHSDQLKCDQLKPFISRCSYVSDDNFPRAYFSPRTGRQLRYHNRMSSITIKKLIHKSFKKEETNVAHGIGKGMLCFFILTSWRNQERRYALAAIWANYIQYSEAFTAQGIKNQAICQTSSNLHITSSRWFCSDPSSLHVAVPECRWPEGVGALCIQTQHWVWSVRVTQSLYQRNRPMKRLGFFASFHFTGVTFTGWRMMKDQVLNS